MLNLYSPEGELMATFRHIGEAKRRLPGCVIKRIGEGKYIVEIERVVCQILAN